MPTIRGVPEPIEPREVELKLGLPSSAEHAKLQGALDAAGGLVRAVRQENLFFDGARGELFAAGLVLRLRVEREDGPERAILTLKARGTRSGDVADRPEWECAVPLDAEAVRRNPSRLLGLDLEPVRELTRRVPELGRLRLLGGFSNLRRVYRVPLNVPAAVPPAHVPTDWELDRSEFPDGSVDYELEVELGRPSAPRETPGASTAREPSGGVAIPAIVSAIRAELERLGIETVRQPLSKYARFLERMTT